MEGQQKQSQVSFTSEGSQKGFCTDQARLLTWHNALLLIFYKLDSRTMANITQSGESNMGVLNILWVSNKDQNVD